MQLCLEIASDDTNSWCPAAGGQLLVDRVHEHGGVAGMRKVRRDCSRFSVQLQIDVHDPVADVNKHVLASVSGVDEDTNACGIVAFSACVERVPSSDFTRAAWSSRFREENNIPIHSV